MGLLLQCLSYLRFLTAMLFNLVSSYAIYVLLQMQLSGRNMPLQKQAFSNMLKILPPKYENFQIKILIFFKFLLKT